MHTVAVSLNVLLPLPLVWVPHCKLSGVSIDDVPPVEQGGIVGKCKLELACQDQNFNLLIVSCVLLRKIC